MKKNVIAIVLSLVMAASSIGTVPVIAAETTSSEAAYAQQGAEQDQEITSEDADDADAAEIADPVPV